MRTEYRLQSCVWEITLACCFSCRYCGSKGGRARAHELTTAECLDVAAQLAALGCRRVSLIGGEVFLRPDWETIVRALTGRGIRTTLITNGFLFTPELLERLRGAEIESVAVSMDGPRAVHDAYRQPGSFDRAAAALDALSGGGIPVSVITTLHSENAPLLEELYAFLRERPLFAWQIQACSPMGNAAASGVRYRFDAKAVIRFVEAHMFEAPFSLGIADNIGYFTQREGWLRGDLSGAAVFGGCRAGLTTVGIDSVGNVRGCESMYDDRFIEGNLRTRRLADIWYDENAFAYNRRFTPDLLTGPCRSCPYGSLCAGGCRSYNYFTHGKLYESSACARNRTASGRD